VKENYGKKIVEVMIMKKIDKDVIEIFVKTLAKTCMRIKIVKFIQKMIKESS